MSVRTKFADLVLSFAALALLITIAPAQASPESEFCGSMSDLPQVCNAEKIAFQKTSQENEGSSSDATWIAYEDLKACRAAFLSACAKRVSQ